MGNNEEIIISLLNECVISFCLMDVTYVSICREGVLLVRYRRQT